MSALLDLPEFRARVARFSVERYERLVEAGELGKRMELIRGVLIDKMSKSPLHSELVKQIFLFLMAFQREGFVVYSERPLRLADSVPEPDAMIVRDCKREFRSNNPTSAELVVEVAVSSAALDRENCSLYAEANVPEYWIVLAQQEAIEVYRQPVGGTYQEKRLYSAGDTLLCGSVPGLQVSVEEWFSAE